MLKKIKLTPELLFGIALLIAIPAFLINLGKEPLIDDEAIRALVAFEMMEKGDFITPTISGELYLKKPPLYNWILAASFSLFDSYDEFAMRFPMVVFLFLFAIIIFLYFRREVNSKFGVINALIFMTTGRMLIYEAFHGLIDIAFSFLIFMFFMQAYTSFNKGKLVRLFTISYFIIAIAFLLKGLPSIVFLGLTLLTLFISYRKFKLLFHWSHFVGILIFLAIVGSYYFVYLNNNDISFEEILHVIIGESSRRTVVRFGIWQTILHLIVFPFDMLYHFLPWTLLVIMLFTKGAFQKIRNHPFLRYMSLVFIVNIVLYWTSPEVYPRYILMFIPLFTGVCTYLYFDLKKSNSKVTNVIDYVFGGVVIISAVVFLIPIFIGISGIVPKVFSYSVILFSAGALLVWLYWKNATNRLIYLAMVLLLVRIGFDVFVIPVRLSDSNEIVAKNMAKEMAELASGNELFFYWNPEIPLNEYYGKRVTSYRFNYYMFMFREGLVLINEKEIPNAFYICPKYFVKDKNVDIIKTFLPAGHDSELVIFKFLN